MPGPSLDTTAHPGGNAASIVASKFSSLAAWTSLSSPTFSTDPGPVLVLAFAGNDGADFTGVTVGGNAMAEIVAPGSGAAPWSGGIWGFWSATQLSSVVVTASKSGSSASTANLAVQVYVGVGNSFANSIGATVVSGADASGTVHASLTPHASNSVLVGYFTQFNDNTAFTADSNTTPWDFGLDAALGTGVIGPASTLLTFSGISQGTVHVGDPVNGLGVTAATVIASFGTGTGGNGTYNVNTSQTIGSESMTIGPLSDAFYVGRYKASGVQALTTAGVAVTFGSSTADAFWGAAAIEILAATAATADSPRPRVRFNPASVGKFRTKGNLSNDVVASAPLAAPIVFPAALVLVASTTQLFLSDINVTWSVLEGAGGGTISAGTGNSATYTAPATPGTYHVQAIVSGHTTGICVVTVVSAPTNPTVRLDSPFQLIDGFGAAESDDQFSPTPTSVLDLMWNRDYGLGLSMYRLGMDQLATNPRADPTDFATAPWDRWDQLHQALKRNPELRIVAGPWTPDPSLKSNGNITGGSLLSANYATWATAMAGFATIAASQNPPIFLYGIFVQNEPDLTASTYSCGFTAAQLVTFTKALGAAMASLPRRPKLLYGEPSDPTLLESYLSALEADSAAMAFVDVYSTHQYGNATFPAATRSARPIWQTEMSGLAGGPEATYDPTITDAIAIFKWIHTALTSGNVRAWIWWWGCIEGATGTPPVISDNQALIMMDGTIGGAAPSQINFTKRLFLMGHFSKFVRPNHQRVNLIGSLPANVTATAYVDPATNRVVVVALNENGTPTNLTISVAGGQTAFQWITPYVTSGTAIGAIGTPGNLEKQARVAASSASSYTVTLPATSIVTLVDAPVYDYQPSSTPRIWGRPNPLHRLRPSLNRVVTSQSLFQAVAGTLSSAGALVKATLTGKAGALTSSGALVKQTQTAKAGTLTSSGSLVRQTLKVLSGALASSGALVKQTSKLLAGTLTSSGTLASVKVVIKAIAGTLTSSGSLALRTGKGLAGSLASAGSIIKSTGKAFAGTLSSAGALSATRVVLKALAGTLTSAGSLTRMTSKALTGTLSSSGSIRKLIAKGVSGALSMFGLLTSSSTAPVVIPPSSVDLDLQPDDISSSLAPDETTLTLE